jgi:hypothetical protein
MTAAKHWLVGYDRQTELEKFELAIPERLFREFVVKFIRVDEDDPEAIGSYELSIPQAMRIAELAGNNRSPPLGLDFFIEAYRQS